MAEIAPKIRVLKAPVSRMRVLRTRGEQGSKEPRYAASPERPSEARATLALLMWVPGVENTRQMNGRPTDARAPKAHFASCSQQGTFGTLKAKSPQTVAVRRTLVFIVGRFQYRDVLAMQHEVLKLIQTSTSCATCD